MRKIVKNILYTVHKNARLSRCQSLMRPATAEQQYL